MQGTTFALQGPWHMAQGMPSQAHHSKLSFRDSKIQISDFAVLPHPCPCLSSSFSLP
ncbi:hypothetical protein BU24DRAFT_419211 [Aaosphaeria arxii CBS 175.79]|uniref:Uncharacterized protein n=1 Tax=Aaosphaeria arxii CBS 175.79 TaxID=1450172 RepID=A0A6A5Y2Z0_9PLEO|nr:uncharacterized protein BU24DRAFT_419211 [Aaosphaeria arxii CBS 175.79]KAF2019603.1 hypothetical protein BU24DRAFT_419211 [Aaosphaeria arxii CBS 175.79]